MPDGEIPPAIRFAILAEVLAVTAMIATLIPLVAIALPGLAFDIALDPDVRLAALGWCAIGIPVLALWMVVAHATHGAALDVGATRQGGRSQRRRALRFGLYACGWDLMTGPLGAARALVSKGAGALELFFLAMRVPGRASMAFLQGVYGLRPDEAARARVVGTGAAIAITLVTAATLVALLLT